MKMSYFIYGLLFVSHFYDTGILIMYIWSEIHCLFSWHRISLYPYVLKVFRFVSWCQILLCVSCSWARTLSTALSCWTLVTRRLWRMQNMTASSSVTLTWSRWTTATSTTATTSRDILPSPWTSLASGDGMRSSFTTRLSETLTMVLFVWWTCQLQLLLYIILLCCKYIEFKSASSCLTEFPLQPLFWQTIVKEQSLIWVNLIILWIPCLQP